MAIEMSLGEYGKAVDRRLSQWLDASVPDRLWKADHTLWTAEPQPEITNRLGWLDLPESMQPEVAGIREFVADVRRDGFTRVVLLGMGGSSLAPDVFARTFGSAPGHPALTVLDSTHPGAVASVADDLPLDATLFVVSSKSGTTIEPLSFMEFFWARSAALGDPGRRFVAITDPGSHLEGIAAERGFRRTFTADPDIGGRYSALSHFGLVPAALIGADIEAMLEAAGRIAAAARAGEAGFALGAALGEPALAGRDKATFFTSPALTAFPDWVEQLIAESTGKDGTGIVPVAGERPGPPAAYGDDRVFAALTLSGDGPDGSDGYLHDLEEAGHPVIRLRLDRREDLAAAMYRAEVAVAMAGSILGIHPFNQPDVQAAKDLAKKAMAGRLDAGSIPAVAASSGDLAAALEDALAGIGPGSYLAFQAFLAPDPEVDAALGRIRHLARDRFRVATTVGYGPRFLHSTGQLHKGGPATGVFLQLVDHPGADLDVPGAGYSFGELISGQADGDHLALTDAGREVLRLDLAGDVASGLREIESVLDA
jgi:transaldolase/glucose-6-phosphate isomerase